MIPTNTCSNQVKSLVTDGVEITDPLKISSRFGLFFISIAAKLRQTLSSISHISPIQLMGNLDRNLHFELSSISIEFVYTQLCAVDTKKSSGMAGIPSRLIKGGASGLAEPLTTLMNRTINEGILPIDWKHEVVTPIHKAGSKTDPSNFRPISVLPIFSKILERAVYGMVYKYLQEHILLSSYQSCFRRLHSTASCLTHVTNTLLHNVDKGLITGLVFLDLSKAFDTLDHQILLDKLSKFGFNRSGIQWVSSYLTNRTQGIYINSIISEPLPVQHGVPQGSVLGPLLFILYINDIPLAVSSCSVELYVDDARIYFSKSLHATWFIAGLFAN